MNVLTVHEFWAERALRRSDQCGDFPIITARSVRVSDRRKATQEDAMQTRKETREAKLHDEETLYSAAQEFAQVATEILTEPSMPKGSSTSCVTGTATEQAGTTRRRWTSSSTARR